MNRLLEGVPRHGLVLLALFAAALVAAPYLVSNYVLSVLIIVLYFAYVGQAWNLMIGFAGLLSLGHALFVGIGAYASAALFVPYGMLVINTFWLPRNGAPSSHVARRRTVPAPVL